MSHDKIKAAARVRMAETGEPYAAARREVIRQHQADSGHSPLPGSTMLLWINGPWSYGITWNSHQRRLDRADRGPGLADRLPAAALCPRAESGPALVPGVATESLRNLNESLALLDRRRAATM
jgi:hypothetical protein